MHRLILMAILCLSTACSHVDYIPQQSLAQQDASYVSRYPKGMTQPLGTLYLSSNGKIRDGVPIHISRNGNRYRAATPIGDDESPVHMVMRAGGGDGMIGLELRISY
jgi:hypothetical protein